jgi:hypothetical protein
MQLIDHAQPILRRLARIDVRLHESIEQRHAARAGCSSCLTKCGSDEKNGDSFMMIGRSTAPRSSSAG